MKVGYLLNEEWGTSIYTVVEVTSDEGPSVDDSIVIRFTPYKSLQDFKLLGGKVEKQLRSSQ